MKTFVALLIFSGLYLHALGSTITVCASGCDYTTIAAALTAANNGDIIHVNVNGAHTENAILINKNVTIKGNGKTVTYIQGAAVRQTATDRVFNIPRTSSGPSGIDTPLKIEFMDMTIRHGYASFLDGTKYSYGGGVQITNGNGTVISFTNVDIKENDTRTSCPADCSNGGGAGMYISCGTGTLGDNTVIVNLTNCVFDDNNTGIASVNSSPSGQQGGAIQMNGKGTLLVKNCIFTNNTAFSSGGVMYNGTAVVGSFSNCTFQDNNVTEPPAGGFTNISISGSGGAFAMRSSIFTFTSCVFKNNSSTGMGGAVWGGTAHSFTNCTFYGNASQYGGAIYRMNGTTNSNMQIVNCTFSGNTASIAGRAIVVGGHMPVTTNAYNISLINTIIGINSGAAPTDIHFYNDYARLVTNQRNYVNSHSGNGITPTFEFDPANSTPGLSAAPANNGGPVETIALDNTSTVVNKGTNTVIGYAIPVKDARSYSRTDDGVDLGAYERAGIDDDAVAPNISYSPLPNTVLTTDRSLSATITDDNGVYPWTALVPRIYFKKGSGGSWQSTSGTLSSGTGRNGTWTFTIANNLVAGVVAGDVIYYYVIAQDVSATPATSSVPAGVVAVDVNTIATPPATLNSYIIESNCTHPTVPVLAASSAVICSGGNATLNIATGALNDATDWKWYTGSCGGTAVGTGISINVSPASTATYYARGEGGCVTPGACGAVSITVIPSVTPSVTIVSSDADNKICAGTSVSFTPTPVNGGAVPLYQWKLNGNKVIVSATYTTDSLKNNDVVSVEMTSNSDCASPATVSSNDIATKVNQHTTADLIKVACDSLMFDNNTYTSSGIYKIVLKNAMGCDSLVTLALTINKSNTGTIIETACDSFALNGQVYFTSGTYLQKLKNSSGCDSILTLQLTIQHLKATATVSGNVLTANTSGGVYQWLNCTGNTIIPGATGQSCIVPATGNYAVIVTAGTCTDTSECYPVIITSVDKYVNKQLDIIAYPNPNAGSFTLQSGKAMQLIIRNELGQIVRTCILNASNNYTVEIQGMESGMYVIQQLNGGAYHKLIVTGI